MGMEIKKTGAEMKNWKVTTKLSRNEITQILNALADARDPYGDTASPLENRLSDLLHKGDRKMNPA
jgi:hypothetical protein